MKETSMLVLGFVLLLPISGCAEPATQAPPAAEPVAETQPAGAEVSAVAADPAKLLPKGKMPMEGLLIGGQPSPAQLEALAGLGYTTVINLRGPAERGSTDPALVESLGMTYVSIPVTSPDDLSEENARKLAEAMGDGTEPVVLHCASSNRVGALLAMKTFYVDDATPEEAMALAKKAGITRMEPAVRQKLGLE
jgi:uncharacterized protein (TIGR01244 family)